MSELVFVGLGLNDEKGISLIGLEELKSAKDVFVEVYTNLLPDFSLYNLERMTGKKINPVGRFDLEEDNGKKILDAAVRGKTVFLVPGDPFIATTHITLRLEACKLGLKTRIVHGSSVISAIIGLSGLNNYKFGKTVTIPFSENFGETPYNVIYENKSRGLHTLCLLDLKVEEKRYLSISKGLELLRVLEKKKKAKVASDDALVVGIARAGSYNPVVKAGYLIDVYNFDFGSAPHSLIFTGKLHFMEADALVGFAGAPKSIRSLI